MGSIFGCRNQFNGTNISLGTPLSYSNLATMILVCWLSQVLENTYAGKSLVEISPVGMELMFWEIYPESMSDSNITDKNLMWLAGLGKTKNHANKRLFKLAMSEKKIQFSEAGEVLISIAPTSIHKHSLGMLEIGLY